MPIESDGMGQPGGAPNQDSSGSATSPGSQNPNRNRNNKRQPNRPRHPSQSGFKGKTEGMDGHEFDVVTDGNTDRFLKTLRELEGYVSRTYATHLSWA